MSTKNTPEYQNRHLKMNDPEQWIVRYAPLIAHNGHVLDLACGGGRHTRLLLDQGYKVTAIDRDTDAISERIGNLDNLTIIEADLETGDDPWGVILSDQQFDGIVVVNYLYRPLFSHLAEALKPGGVLLYETFAMGNEEYSRPRNPDHLLKTGELLNWASSQGLQVVAYEHGLVNVFKSLGVKQRIAVVKSDKPGDLTNLSK